MKLYRVMKLDADGKPLIGQRRNRLGVRPTDPKSRDPKKVFDVRATNDAVLVVPGEGLSTSLDQSSQARRVGRGEAVFEIDTVYLPGELAQRQDRGFHCLIEPGFPMTLAEFRLALEGTRDLWQRV